MVKLAIPKIVVLPNSRTFHAKYKRVRPDALPNNVRIRRTYRRRASRSQRGGGIKDVLVKRFRLAK